MPGERSGGREGLAWLAVALWSGVIFATVPLARAIEEVVEGAWGEQSFLYAVGLSAAGAAIGAVLGLHRAGRLSPGRAAGLAGIALLYGGCTFALRREPVEAMHLVQYGLLGALAFRALAFRVQDASLYLGAALVGGSVGLLDEAIQWATPRRFWDLRDIGINFLGAGLIQVGIAAGLRPAVASRAPTARGVQVACRIAMLGAALLLASLLNTPDRIAAYSRWIPGLDALRTRPDVMIEYGHLHHDPGIATFRSRFTRDALLRIDAARGREAGERLASFEGDYETFLARHSPITDPFLHEARVHLFRRDHYLDAAREHPPGSSDRRAGRTVAFREQLLLERYFPRTLRHSGMDLPSDERAALAAEQDVERRYTSKVSKELVTRFDQRHVLAAGSGVLLLLLAGDRWAARRMTPRFP